MLLSSKSISKIILSMMKFVVFCVLSIASLTIFADENNSDSWQTHGFIAQGIIDADGSNYINDKQELSTRLTEIGLNTSYQLSDDFRIAGQAVYLNGGNRYHEGLRLDYLVVDWDAFHNENWQANVYLGRFKNNHWLYSGTRDIPFARPSIILPQSVYFDGFRDIAVGGDGAAIKLTYSDNVIGELDFNFSRGESAISNDQSKVAIGEMALGEIDHDLDTQASIYWRPLFSQWQFGLSLLDSNFRYQQASVDNFSDSDFTFQFYTVNALYEGEYWEFSGEVYQERFVIDGFYFPGFHRDDIGQGYYLQARFQLTEQTKLLIRREGFYASKDDKNGSKLERETSGMIPRYFGYHNDSTVGVSFDLSSQIRLNAEFHWVEGAARLSPIVSPDPVANNSKHWQVWALQLMYWF